jgi:hypothetical protein
MNDKFIKESNERRLHFMRSCGVIMNMDELTEEKWGKFWNNYCQIRKRKNKINKLKKKIWIQNGM